MSSTSNKVSNKSYSFALKVVKPAYTIQTEKKEYILTKQLIRYATSIGANSEEAIGGISDKDFLYKLTISYKEARESKYWIRLLKDAEFISKDISKELLDDVEEILKMLGASSRTMKNKTRSK